VKEDAMFTDPTLASVGELMTRDPIIVSIDAPLPEVAELLDRFDISGLPVVDREGQLVGVISQTDLLRARAAEELWAQWPEAHHVHRLVIVADDGTTPIGVISTTDLVRAMAARTDR
jgi:CBS domain-containing protein